MTDPTDEQIEEAYADAENAAIHAYGPLGAPIVARNPYPQGSELADIWYHAFRNFYARENGY